MEEEHSILPEQIVSPNTDVSDAPQPSCSTDKATSATVSSDHDLEASFLSFVCWCVLGKLAEALLIMILDPDRHGGGEGPQPSSPLESGTDIVTRPSSPSEGSVDEGPQPPSPSENSVGGGPQPPSPSKRGVDGEAHLPSPSESIRDGTSHPTSPLEKKGDDGTDWSSQPASNNGTEAQQPSPLASSPDEGARPSSLANSPDEGAQPSSLASSTVEGTRHCSFLWTSGDGGSQHSSPLGTSIDGVTQQSSPVGHQGDQRRRKGRRGTRESYSPSKTKSRVNDRSRQSSPLGRSTAAGPPQSSSSTERGDEGQDGTTVVSWAHSSPVMPSQHMDIRRTKGLAPFTGARNFVINNPLFYNLEETQAKHSDPDPDPKTVLEWLADRVISGVEFDSSERHPPPRCHPLTRKTIRTRISNWYRNQKREKRLLWLQGPAGVGKSAIIQTLAESEQKSGLLGATLFFSRPNHRNDPARVVITLAYQLATRSPPYQVYLKEQMVANPRLLEKGLKEQFNILIVEPFTTRDSCKNENDRLILIDGLDECEGEQYQCEIIELISKFVLAFPTAPLVWIITSRPEAYLKVAFSHGDTEGSHLKERIEVDSTEACGDVEIYLKSAFENISRRYPYAIAQDTQWPTENQLSILTEISSGLFIFASTAIRFVDDINLGDPVSQLEYLLAFIKEMKLGAEDNNPLALLDALYTRILSSIPRTALRVMKLLLSYCVILSTGPNASYSPFPFSQVCNLLDLKQNVAYGALQKLHSVLRIPSPSEAHCTRLSCYHTSFADFLQDPLRSHSFSINALEIGTEVWRRYFQVLQEANETDSLTPQITNVTLSWPSPQPEMNDEIKKEIFEQAKWHWADQLIPRNVASSASSTPPISLSLEERYDALSQIDFRRLCRGYTGWHHYIAFALWLSKIPDESLLRQKGVMNQISLSHVDLDQIHANEINYPPHLHFQPQSKTWGIDKYYCISDSEKLQRRIRRRVKVLKQSFPSTRALVYGAATSRRCIIFRCEETYHEQRTGEMFVLPYS